MEQVADALTQHAVATDSLLNANLFGRSAFNRYYYGVFLAVREMIRYGHPEIVRFPHKTMPDDLTGKLREKIVDVARERAKRGLISHAEQSQFVERASTALRELAEILKEGYRIREIADYEPSVLATVQNGHVLLDDKTSDAARNWGRRAERAIGQVKHVWRQLGLTN